jgi:hypothetical protein
MTYHVTATRWEHYWVLNIDGIGVTQSEGLDDAEAMVRDYLRLEDLDSTAPIEITFEFEGTDSLHAA